MKNPTDNITLEEMFDQINGIIEELEDKDIPIEDAFSKYESGMKLLESCNDRIDVIEKKVLALNADGTLDDFD